MNNIFNTVNGLYEKYRDEPNTISKFENHIINEMPLLIEQFHKQEKNRIIIEKESEKYLQNFFNPPNKQYFYIEKTDTFISYNGINYSLINEDDIWHIILSDVSNIPLLIKWKEKIKNKLILEIKKNKIISSMPESKTIQNLIDLIVPNLFETKQEAKYFFAVLGDNILTKNKYLIHYCPEESKSFFDSLNQFVLDYFGELNLNQTFRFRYNEAHDYKKCRILKLKTSFTKNFDFCNLIFKKHLFNLISISCHYSKRYGNSDKYIKNQGTENIINRIYYLEKTNSEKIIEDFKNQLLIDSSNNHISKRDMYFLWCIFLKNLSLPNIIYKSNFFKTLENKLQFSSNNFQNIYSKYLGDIEIFKQFWKSNIESGENIDDEYEISELKALFNYWCENQQKKKNLFTEKNLIYIVKYYYNNVSINEKLIDNTFCHLWNKKDNLREAINDKFDITDDEIQNNIRIRKAYEYYCEYATKHGHNFIVSKQYFEKYIDRIVPQQYIENNYIKKEFWN